jgi:hypothetical protein
MENGMTQDAVTLISTRLAVCGAVTIDQVAQ